MTAREAYQLIITHLDKVGIHYDRHDDDLAITMTVHGNDLPQPTQIFVHEHPNIIRVTSPIPFKMPEDKFADAAMAVAVANYGMANGCFDMDLRDGEISYRLTQSFEGCDLTEETVNYVLGCVFYTTDRYNDRFFALGMGLMSLEDFIEKDE